jgi:hypothetical protein
MAVEKSSNGGTCTCGCGTGGRHWTFFLLRVLITILILMVVFWFGLAVGRMSSGYARGAMLMRRGYAYPMGMQNAAGGAMPMMGSTTTPTTGNAAGGY